MQGAGESGSSEPLVGLAQPTAASPILKVDNSDGSAATDAGEADFFKSELADLRVELGMFELTETAKEMESRSLTPHKYTSGGRRRRSLASRSRSSDSESAAAEREADREPESRERRSFAAAHRGVRRRTAGLVLAKQFAKRVLLRTFGNSKRGTSAGASRPTRGRNGTTIKRTADGNIPERRAAQVAQAEGVIDGENATNSDGPILRNSIPSDDDDGWMEVNDEASSEASSGSSDESSERDSVFGSSCETYKIPAKRRSSNASATSASSSERPEESATPPGAPEPPALGQFLLPLLAAPPDERRDGRGITLIHDKILEILSSTEEQVNLQEVVADCELNADGEATEQLPYEDVYDQELPEVDITDMLKHILQEDPTDDGSVPQEAVDSTEDMFVSMDVYPDSPQQFSREYGKNLNLSVSCKSIHLRLRPGVVEDNGLRFVSSRRGRAVVVTESDTKWSGLLKLPCLCCHCRNKKTYIDLIRNNLSLVISVLKLNEDTAKEAEILEAMLEPVQCVCTLFYTNIGGVSQSCHRCTQSCLDAKIQELRSSVQVWRHLSQLVQVINNSKQLSAAADVHCCCQRPHPEYLPYKQVSLDEQIHRAIAFFINSVKDNTYFKVDLVPASEDVPKSRAMRFLDYVQKNSRLKIAPLRKDESKAAAKEWSPPCPHCTCSCSTIRVYSRAECTKALTDALQRMHSLAVTAGLADMMNDELIPELAVMLTESRAAIVAFYGTKDTAHKLLTDIIIGCEWSCGIHLLKSPQIIYDASVCTAYAVFTTLLARRFLEIACHRYPKTKRALILMITNENFDLFSSFMLARAFMGELTTYNDSYLTLDDVNVTEFDERLTMLVNVLSINTIGIQVQSIVDQPEESPSGLLKPETKSIPGIEKFITQVKTNMNDDKTNAADEIELELLHTMDYLIKTAKSLVSLMYIVLNHAGLQGKLCSAKMNGSLSDAYTIMQEFHAPFMYSSFPPLRCCSGGHQVQDWRCLNKRLLEFDNRVTELYARLPSIHRTQTRALQKMLDVLKETYPVGMGVTLSSLRYCHMAVPLLSRAMIAHQIFTPRQAQRMLAWLVYTRVLGHSHLFNEVRRKVLEIEEQYEVFVRLRLNPLKPPTSISEMNIVKIESMHDVPPPSIARKPPADQQQQQQQRAGKRKLRPTKSEDVGEGGKSQPDIFYFNYKKHEPRTRDCGCKWDRLPESSMSMRECIAKFAKCTVNCQSEESGERKNECRSPPLADVPPRDSDSKPLFRRVKGPLRLGQSGIGQFKTEIPIPASSASPPDCDPNDVMLIESVAPLEDKVEEILASAKDEHCKNKCCENEIGNANPGDAALLITKTGKKPILNGLVAKCMQEATKISNMSDDAKVVPGIILAIMPEVAAKLAELVSISTELPDFASILCSIPEYLEDGQQLSPETIKQLKELKMTRNDSKIVKSKFKTKKTKTESTDRKTLMEALREEIEQEVLTFFKIKDRPKEEQNMFSLWARWMIIDKILDHVKQYVSEGDSCAGLEACRGALPKLNDLQALSLETLATLRKLALTFPGGEEAPRRPNGLSPASKAALETDKPAFDQTKQAYFMDKLQAINENYVSKVHKKKFTSEDWIMTMNELQELERRLKSAFERPAAGGQRPAEAREAELLAGKGLSKLIGKSSAKRPDAAPKTTAHKTLDRPPAKDTADNQTQTKCTSIDPKLLAESECVAGKKSSNQQSSGSQSQNQKETPSERSSDKSSDRSDDKASSHSECDGCQHSNNGCPSANDSDSCGQSEDSDFGCCTTKGKHIAFLGSQNPEAMAKYTALALRQAKQSLNASAFPQADGAATNGTADAAATEGIPCCSRKQCRKTQPTTVKANKELPASDAKATATKLQTTTPATQHRNVKKCDATNNSGHHYICRVGHVDGNGSGCGGNSGGHSCNCCYCAVYGHAPPLTSPVSKAFNETRERLRSILLKKKQQEKPDGNGTDRPTTPDESPTSEEPQPLQHQKAQTEQSVQTVKPPPGFGPLEAAVPNNTKAKEVQKESAATQTRIQAVEPAPAQTRQPEAAAPAAKASKAGPRLAQTQTQTEAPAAQSRRPAQPPQTPERETQKAPPVQPPKPPNAQNPPPQNAQADNNHNNSTAAAVNGPKLTTTPASSRDVSVSSVSSGCFSYTTLCPLNCGRRSASGPAAGCALHASPAQDPRDLDALLQFIEGPAKAHDKTKKRAKKARQKARKLEIRLIYELKEANKSVTLAEKEAVKMQEEVATRRAQVEEMRRNLKKLKKPATPGPQPAQNSKKKGKKGSGMQNNQVAANIQALTDDLAKATQHLKEAEQKEERTRLTSHQAHEISRRAQLDLRAALNATGGSTLYDVDDVLDETMPKYTPRTPSCSPPPSRIENSYFNHNGDGTVTFRRVDGQTLALMSDGSEVPLSQLANHALLGTFVPEQSPSKPVQTSPKKQTSAPTSWEAAMAQINAVANTSTATAVKKVKEKVIKKPDPPERPSQPIPVKKADPPSVVPAPPKKLPQTKAERKLQTTEEVVVTKLNKKERKELAKKAEETARIEEELKAARKLKEKEKAEKSKKKGTVKDTSKHVKPVHESLQTKKGKKGQVEVKVEQPAPPPPKNLTKNQMKNQAAALHPQNNQSQKINQKQNQIGKNKPQQAQQPMSKPTSKKPEPPSYYITTRAADTAVAALTKRLDTSLKLNSDTTIELSNSKKAPVPTQNMRNSPTACSIMEQLSCGVQVSDLRLPPGITLTRVEASKQRPNPVKSIPMRPKNVPAVPTPPQPPAVIRAPPPPPPPPVPPSPPPGQRRKGKKKRERDRERTEREKERERGEREGWAPTRPPVPAPLRLPEPIPMPPAARATITPAPNGMFTIRSPMLAASEARPGPARGPPGAGPPSGYSLFPGAAAAAPPPPHPPARQRPIGTPARPPIAPEASGLYSLFSPPAAADDSLPYFQRLRAGARLNNEVTIHHVTDSKYYRPNFPNIPEAPIAQPTPVEATAVPQPVQDPYVNAYRPSMKTQPAAPATAPWNYGSPSTSSSSLSSSLETAANNRGPATSLYGSVGNSTSNSPAQQQSIAEPMICMPANIGENWAAWTSQPEVISNPIDPWSSRGNCQTPTDTHPTAQFGPIGSHRHTTNPSLFTDCGAPQYPNSKEPEMEPFKHYDYYMDTSQERLRNSLSSLQLDNK